MAWISAGSGWSAQTRLNLAAMMTRRSLAVMSAVDGPAFEVYQGASRRRGPGVGRVVAGGGVPAARGNREQPATLVRSGLSWVSVPPVRKLLARPVNL
jgi:hypothetical protein